MEINAQAIGLEAVCLSELVLEVKTLESQGPCQLTNFMATCADSRVDVRLS